MKALLFLVLLCVACGGPPVATSTPTDAGRVAGDGGSSGPVDGGGPFTDGGLVLTEDGGIALPDGGTAPNFVVRPLYFATSDQPLPANGLALVDALWGAMRVRLAEELKLSVKLAPAVLHQSAKSCAQLGADAQLMLSAIAQELGGDGSQKFQVLVPCDDPTQTAAGIAYVGGRVAVTFDGARQLGTSSAQAYLSTVATHELGHNLGLLHNSVGNNCMGPVELKSFALGLLGNSDTTPCVMLPYQAAEIVANAPQFVTAAAASGFSSGSPSLIATPSRVSGKWQVQLAWIGSAPAGSSGWHIDRNAIRVLRAKVGASSASDTDGAAEYHNDPQMTDPGLVDGMRYCYRLRAFDASGVEGTPGAEACVDL